MMAMLARANTGFAATDFVLEPQPETSCPDVAALREALETRLGNRDGGSSWRLVYGQVAASNVGAQRLWLELRDRADRMHLRRELPLPGPDCGKVADAIALIVDRFFEDLGWTAGSPLPEPMPLPPPPAPPAVEAPRVPTRFWVEGGGGLSTRRNLGGTALAGARVERGGLGVALHLMVPTAIERQFRPEGGEASLSGLGGAVSIVWRGQSGRTGWFIGPVATVFRESARSQDIAVAKTESATSLTGGLTAGASVALGSHWRVGADATVSRALVGDRFVIAGWGPVLEPSPFQTAAVARVAYSFAP